jgi:GntR family transcriptional regulator/MocR family aminotransferase
VTGVAAGLHAVVLLPAGTDEGAVVAAAAERGVGVAGLADMHASGPSHERPPGVVLGYAPLSEHAIAEGVRRLGEVVSALAGS